MTSIDEQFIEFIVKSLVGNPDEVSIERSVDEKGVLLELTVDPEDLGRVIGKRGATAQSMRTLLRALGTKNEARYNLKIVDNGVDSPKREEDHKPRASKKATKQEESLNDYAAELKEELGVNAPAKEEPATRDEPVVKDDPTTKVEPETKEETLAEKTLRELDDLDDLDI